MSGNNGWSTCSSLVMIRVNKDWSPAANTSLIAATSSAQYSGRCIVIRTHRVARGHSPSRGRTRLSFAMTVTRKTFWRELAGSPWSWRTRIVHSELEQDVSSALTWSGAVNLSLITTPSAVILCTWQMSRHRGGNTADFPRVSRLVNTISFDFKQFSFRLFSSVKDRACTGIWVDYICVVSKLYQCIAMCAGWKLELIDWARFNVPPNT